MPRIRSIHPDICDDEVLAEVSAYAERTFLRLWTHLDDKGRGLDNPKLWKGKLYPLHDDVTSERVERDLSELAARGLLIRYEVDGKRYLCAKAAAWAKYQKPNHPTPSKLPAPPEPSGSPLEPSSPSSRGVELETERSGRGAEGESEGEGPSTGTPSTSKSPTAAGLEARAAKLALLPGGSPALPDRTVTDRDAPASPLPSAASQGREDHGGAA